MANLASLRKCWKSHVNSVFGCFRVSLRIKGLYLIWHGHDATQIRTCLEDPVSALLAPRFIRKRNDVDVSFSFRSLRGQHQKHLWVSTPRCRYRSIGRSTFRAHGPKLDLTSPTRLRILNALKMLLWRVRSPKLSRTSLYSCLCYMRPHGLHGAS